MKSGKPDPKPMDALVARIARHVNVLAGITVLLVVQFVFIAVFPELFERAFVVGASMEVERDLSPVVMDEGIENGIHVESGLIVDADWELVLATCTACHSAKLVTQNRADREGWTRMIRWMQETQNLWDLGDNEALILDYLAKNYPPKKKGRRARLTNIEWYDLEP